MRTFYIAQEMLNGDLNGKEIEKKRGYMYVVVIVVQSPSHLRLFMTPCTEPHQASLSLIISWSLPKFMSIESVMLSNHPILCHPLFLLPSIFPSIRVFSNESALHIKWPKYWSFSISPSSEYLGLVSLGLTD